MSRVDDLLRAFTAEFRTQGDADPRRYLREVTGADRSELAALIDHFLATAPAPAFDAGAFAAFRAQHETLVDRLLDDIPPLLELRRAAGLTKAEVGARLAGELGLAGQESAVKGAYHEIETGHVEPDRVRDRIWDALAGIYDTSAARLRRATEAAFDVRPHSSSAVFARSTESDAAARGEAPGEAVVRQAFFVD